MPSGSRAIQRVAIYFPGSTIGNFSTHEAVALLGNMRRLIATRPCWMLLGVDMTQDAARLEAAYDDAAGITAQFNLNLLVRNNRDSICSRASSCVSVNKSNERKASPANSFR